MWYLFWITYVSITYVAYAFVSKLANESDSWNWVIVLFVMGLLGGWPIIARYSTNLILDGLLFDAIIFFSFYLTMLYLGAAKTFTPAQWMGALLAAVGLVLLKVGEYIELGN